MKDKAEEGKKKKKTMGTLDIISIRLPAIITGKAKADQLWKQNYVDLEQMDLGGLGWTLGGPIGGS